MALDDSDRLWIQSEIRRIGDAVKIDNEKLLAQLGELEEQQQSDVAELKADVSEGRDEIRSIVRFKRHLVTYGIPVVAVIGFFALVPNFTGFLIDRLISENLKAHIKDPKSDVRGTFAAVADGLVSAKVKALAGQTRAYFKTTLVLKAQSESSIPIHVPKDHSVEFRLRMSAKELVKNRNAEVLSAISVKVLSSKASKENGGGERKSFFTEEIYAKVKARKGEFKVNYADLRRHFSDRYENIFFVYVSTETDAENVLTKLEIVACVYPGKVQERSSCF